VLVLAAYFDRIAVAALSAGVTAGGIVFAALFERARSLTGAWIAHAFVDAALMAIGASLVFG